LQQQLKKTAAKTAAAVLCKPCHNWKQQQQQLKTQQNFFSENS